MGQVKLQPTGQRRRQGQRHSSTQHYGGKLGALHRPMVITEPRHGYGTQLYPSGCLTLGIAIVSRLSSKELVMPVPTRSRGFVTNNQDAAAAETACGPGQVRPTAVSFSSRDRDSCTAFDKIFLQGHQSMYRSKVNWTVTSRHHSSIVASCSPAAGEFFPRPC